MNSSLDKPYVLLKCAMSLDGYIDDTSNERLILSSTADLDRVDHERSLCDAILVGAQTLRTDNPKLLIKSDARKMQRLEKSLPKDIAKVTITSSGNLSKDLRFFSEGDCKKIVYCSENAYSKLYSELSDVADIVSSSEKSVDPEFILNDLKKRGINKLMIEGGSQILTMFLSKGLADELQISVAPFFVGDKNAPKFVNEAPFLYNKLNRLILSNVELLGDCALLTYYMKGEN